MKTLKLLYASHTRNGKELQRRINSQPSLPRPTQVGLSIHQPHQNISSHTIAFEKNNSNHSNQTPLLNNNTSKAIHVKSEKSIETGPSESMIAGMPEYFMGQSRVSQSNELETLINEDVYWKKGKGSFYH